MAVTQQSRRFNETANETLETGRLSSPRFRAARMCAADLRKVFEYRCSSTGVRGGVRKGVRKAAPPDVREGVRIQDRLIM